MNRARSGRAYQPETGWAALLALVVGFIIAPVNHLGAGTRSSACTVEESSALRAGLPNEDSNTASGHPGAVAGWTDVTSGPLADPGGGFGVSWGDYDGDGDHDLCVAQEYSSPSLRLLRNDGAGVFVDATIPFASIGPARIAVWGDADNDGDLDLYRSNYFEQNFLYRNDGGALSAMCGMCIKGDGSAAWGDYDLDGDLDMAFVPFPGAGVYLYRNDGGLSFMLVTSLTAGGTTRAGLWVDYDGDGDLDLHQIVDGPDRLLRNAGGAFDDATPIALADGDNASTAAWGDYDNDGDPDVYLPKLTGTNRLFRNDEAGTFTDVTASTPLGLTGDSRDASWVDCDNDGDLDLFVVRGTSENVLFRNDGGVFENAGSSALDGVGVRRAAAWSDYDGDGDLDVYVTTDSTRGRLVRNDLPAGSGHWLHMDLVGSLSNRNGIGARVSVKAGGAWRMRDVTGGTGFSQGSLTVEFGLGIAVVADSIVVRWPSGLTQIRTSVPADRRITVFESATVAVPPPRITIRTELLPPAPNPTRGSAALGFVLASEQAVRFEVVDVNGRSVRLLADRGFSAGRHEFRWDGMDANGRRTPAGLYWVQLRAGPSRQSRGLVRLR